MEAADVASAKRATYEECLTSCLSCAAAAERCAAHCSRQENAAELVNVICVARTSADVCLLTARLISQGSDFVQEYCALCAEVCHTLREECLKQPGIACCDHCSELALHCDRACQKAAV